MMELFQTEWCPSSRRIRERLTELDVAYLIRQVPVDAEERDVLLAATGSRVIPALLLENGTALTGEGQIRAWLDSHIPEPAGAEPHRRKAAKAHRRELDEALAGEHPAASDPTTPLEVLR